ncbi:serine/threonine-protein kinase pakD-like [Oppia nitens]|uniref:serine/threonine-protein kinase pakD-like n=1 Tax=Oppia nitens TaxID=1686743 RepID=UPI0023DA365A|nr:serine/threonine-protein kinase pakD-like [Oppia nitens]
MTYRFKYYLIKRQSLLCLIISLLSSLITSAPVSESELCSVSLVPNKLIAKRFDESVLTIRCQASVQSLSAAFTNPVFDLSFGGAPRTGIFILRGNVDCDDRKTRCWSEYQIAATSLGHLIQHTGDIGYSCQVADQLKASDDKKSSLARCEAKGSLAFSNILKYGDPCGTNSMGQECDRNMECASPETESEIGKQCVCRTGFVAILENIKQTVCLQEVPLGMACNYSKQCTALDDNSNCQLLNGNNGTKVCKCSANYEEYSDPKMDYKKKCLSNDVMVDSGHKHDDHYRQTTTISTTTDHKNDDLIDTYNNSSYNNNNNTKADYKTSPNRESSGSIGIILFFLAILLAIIIVIIIIRARNKSDKMVINKKRQTVEQQTDDNDGEQSEPILANNDTIGARDEVDNDIDGNPKSDEIISYENNEQTINNKINSNINNNDNEKVQTNV